MMIFSIHAPDAFDITETESGHFNFVSGFSMTVLVDIFTDPQKIIAGFNTENICMCGLREQY
ncbi:MAG: hypothetical protein EHM37_16030 [Deltaproteobacteria bacterium]|nr:MAG: hypothetical protein EHM37_16030 [Deltaproteobacteria bacterium]